MSRKRQRNRQDFVKIQKINKHIKKQRISLTENHPLFYYSVYYAVLTGKIKIHT